MNTDLTDNKGLVSKRNIRNVEQDRISEADADSSVSTLNCEERRHIKFVASASSLRALGKYRVTLDLSALNGGKIEINWTQIRSTQQRPREYASDLLARSASILARSALILARAAPLNAYEVNACRRRRCAWSVVIYAPGVLKNFIRNRNKGGLHRHLCIKNIWSYSPSSLEVQS